MKFFKPQLQLAKVSEIQDGPGFKDHYYLHVVTFCDQANYRTSDEDTEIDDSALASRNIIQVKLYIYPDQKLPDFKYLTPLVHTIDLGTPGEKAKEFNLKVDVFKELPTRGPGAGGSSGSSQTSSSDADEIDRPLGN